MRVPAVFFASGNQGKIIEVGQILHEMLPDLTVYSFHDFPDWAKEVAETGQNYHDNALLKCQAFADNPRHLPVIADDSGLEVLAFPGLLGIHSHRWCKTQYAISNCRTPAEALQQKLDGVEDRRVIFHTSFCYLEPGSQPVFFDADLPGTAATTLAAGDGFDFDPIFIPQGYTVPYAAIGQATKNQISQRRQALDQLAAFLQKD